METVIQGLGFRVWTSFFGYSWTVMENPQNTVILMAKELSVSFVFSGRRVATPKIRRSLL